MKHNQPWTPEDEAIRRGEDAGNITRLEPVLRRVYRTFTISELICVEGQDDSQTESWMAAEDCILTPKNILKAIQAMYPLSNITISEVEDEENDPVSAKEAKNYE